MSAAASPVSPVPVPEELSRVPAGALLASVLEDIDIEQVSGHDTVEIMLAEYRVWCRQTARLYRAVLETGLRRPFSIDTVQRVTTPGEFAAEEARAALAWSRTRAERTIGFAFDLFHQLPALGEAMLAGELDEPRARAFIDWTDGLDNEHAHAVCEQLLPDAAGLTVGELIEQIKRACLAIDPNWAEKRYRQAVKARRVRGFLGPDGTGTLTGQSQPAERVIAACEHIDALARACKRAGDQRKIDYIRSDLFLGLTDGTLEGLTEPEIIEYLLARPYVVPGDDTDGDTNQGLSSGGPGGGSADGDGSRPTGDGSPADGGSAASGRGDSSSDTDDGGGGGPGSSGPGRSSGSGMSTPDWSAEPAAPAEPAESDAEPTANDVAEPAEPEPASSAAVTRAGGGKPATQARAVPELRIQLGTLLGLNGEPAEVPSWGYLPARLARHLVAQMHSAEWRYAHCDYTGHVINGGLITTRPLRPDGVKVCRDVRRGGIVEIALRADDPSRLTGMSSTGPVAAWAPVLAEIAQVVRTPGGTRQTGTPDPTRRTPGAVLRRWIQQRDRRCVHPRCRVPASKADQDHRIGYAQRGPTTEANLSAPCRHDHRLKDEGHWTLTTPRPGLTIWTSPLGYQYESRPPPAIPRPILTRAREDTWEPPGGLTSQLDESGCMITPCQHDAPDATEHANGNIAKPREPDVAAPEPEMLDDADPPF
jgi:hypothetical protein